MDFEHIAFLEALAEKKGVTETEIVERGISELAAQEFSPEERKELVAQKLKQMLDL